MTSATTDVADVFSGFPPRDRGDPLLTIVFGLGLAIFSIGRVQSLERESRAALSGEVAQAREELHRLSARLVAAQEEERRNLSRELHDEVGQSMSALLVELGNLASDAAAGQAALHEQRASA